MFARYRLSRACSRQSGPLLALALLRPGRIGIGRWYLPWQDIEKIVVYQDKPGPLLLGAQLRSARGLPPKVRPEDLDQTIPDRPVLLAGMDLGRLGLDDLTRWFRAAAPPGIALVTSSGGSERSLMDPVLRDDERITPDDPRA